MRRKVIPYIVIPSLTILLALQAPLTNANFSDISSKEGYRLWFISYGLFIIVFWLVELLRIIVSKSIRNICLFSLICLAIMTVVPYNAKTTVFWSNMHIDLGILGLSVLMMSIFWAVLNSGNKLNLYSYVALIIITFSSYFYFGMVNSLVESFFIISFSLFLSSVTSKSWT